MEIVFKPTEKEKILLLLFNEKKSLSTSNDFDGWRGSTTFRTLLDFKLIYHCNREDDGAYIRYALTDLGKMAVSQIQ
jgi:predicted transcriptional regulator